MLWTPIAATLCFLAIDGDTRCDDIELDVSTRFATEAHCRQAGTYEANRLAVMKSLALFSVNIECEQRAREVAA